MSGKTPSFSSEFVVLQLYWVWEKAVVEHMYCSEHHSPSLAAFSPCQSIYDFLQKDPAIGPTVCWHSFLEGDGGWVIGTHLRFRAPWATWPLYVILS